MGMNGVLRERRPCRCRLTSRRLSPCHGGGADLSLGQTVEAHRSVETGRVAGEVCIDVTGEAE